jgi:predicted phosphoribosyltransferase
MVLTLQLLSHAQLFHLKLIVYPPFKEIQLAEDCEEFLYNNQHWRNVIVTKNGCATGVTTAKIRAISSISIELESLVVGPFAAPDSGSLVIDQQSKRIIGVLSAINVQQVEQEGVQTMEFTAVVVPTWRFYQQLTEEILPSL